jgi:hypothetical protein
MLRRACTALALVAATICSAPSTRADEPARAGESPRGQKEAPPRARVFDVVVAKGKVAPSQRVLKVSHQDEVSITWTVDRPQTIHLEGYDVVVEAHPGQPATMKFKAFATGRFPVHAHEIGQGDAKKHAHGHGALLRLEVHPR